MIMVQKISLHPVYIISRVLLHTTHRERTSDFVPSLNENRRSRFIHFVPAYLLCSRIQTYYLLGKPACSRAANTTEQDRQATHRNVNKATQLPTPPTTA